MPIIKIIGSVSRTILVGKNNYFHFKVHGQCVKHQWKYARGIIYLELEILDSAEEGGPIEIWEYVLRVDN